MGRCPKRKDEVGFFFSRHPGCPSLSRWRSMKGLAVRLCRGWREVPGVSSRALARGRCTFAYIPSIQKNQGGKRGSLAMICATGRSTNTTLHRPTGMRALRLSNPPKCGGLPEWAQCARQPCPGLCTKIWGSQADAGETGGMDPGPVQVNVGIRGVGVRLLL